MRQHIMTFGLVALFAAALPVAAMAAAPAAMQGGNQQAALKEAKTAHAHALMASNAKSLKMTHTHLHHVVNCLVGPGGKGFDTSVANPCKGMGQGAKLDAAGDSGLEDILDKALAAAQSGLHADTKSAAHKAAKKAAKFLAKAGTQ